MFLMMPLVFASNVFVDPQTMPDWLQPAVEVNPVSVVVGSVRDLMGGTFDVGSVGLVLLYCAVLVSLFSSLSMLIYNR